jgi:hypothetical protein
MYPTDYWKAVKDLARKLPPEVWLVSIENLSKGTSAGACVVCARDSAAQRIVEKTYTYATEEQVKQFLLRQEMALEKAALREHQRQPRFVVQNAELEQFQAQPGSVAPAADDSPAPAAGEIGEINRIIDQAQRASPLPISHELEEEIATLLVNLAINRFRSQASGVSPVDAQALLELEEKIYGESEKLTRDVDEKLNRLSRCIRFKGSEIQPYTPAGTAALQRIKALLPDERILLRSSAAKRDPERSTKQPARRSRQYEQIDEALRQVAESRPKSHEEALRLLDHRTRLPNAEPFVSAKGWIAGFNKDPRAARAWLSKQWSRLNLPPFPRGPK